MIIIDGSKTDMSIENFSNLEEILVRAVADKRLENRIVTDVLLNDKLFSELYPHQAEDIESCDIQSVEIRSVPIGDMAIDMAQELFKVIDLLTNGSRTVATLFRQADDNEALEMLQDMLDVSRDFLAMLNTLSTQFFLSSDVDFNAKMEKFSSLLGEMTEVLQNEDWVLLADLLEYEFVPVCDDWRGCIQHILDALSQKFQG